MPYRSNKVRELANSSTKRAGELAAATKRKSYEVVTDKRFQVTAASAAAGATTCGTAGGAVGTLAGAGTGAVVGVPAALFTFGLSIPVCATIGAGLGCAAGATTGAAAGGAAGGAAGFHTHKYRKEIADGASSAWGAVQSGTSKLKTQALDSVTHVAAVVSGTQSTPDGGWRPRTKYFHTLTAEMPSMRGKTVAITGCTSGTGRVLAEACLQLGATVVLVNRPSERAGAAFQELLALSREAEAPAPVRVDCDLTDFGSVREAGRRLCERLGADGLDVLCNNAGMAAFGDVATRDGYDIQMQTNHLSHFLLTSLCMPVLKRAAALRGEARVVNHSSVFRKIGGVQNELDAKYMQRNGGRLGGSADTATDFTSPNFQRYQQSKLANVVFTYALHDRLAGTPLQIKSFCAHPGTAATNVAANSRKAGFMKTPGLPDCVVKLGINMTQQSDEDGACGILLCCCDPEVVAGGFYGPRGNNEQSRNPRQSHTENKGTAALKSEEPLAHRAARALLWRVSCEETGATWDDLPQDNGCAA